MDDIIYEFDFSKLTIEDAYTLASVNQMDDEGMKVLTVVNIIRRVMKDFETVPFSEFVEVLTQFVAAEAAYFATQAEIGNFLFTLENHDSEED